MLSDNVAQNPTMPVRAGKKNWKNAGVLSNFEGCCRIGPNPSAAEIAQNKSASAASGKKKALKTRSFRMLSTPRYTIHMLSSQKRTNVIAGPVARPKDSGRIGGKFSNEGN